MLLEEKVFIKNPIERRTGEKPASRVSRKYRSNRVLECVYVQIDDESYYNNTRLFDNY